MKLTILSNLRDEPIRIHTVGAHQITALIAHQITAGMILTIPRPSPSWLRRKLTALRYSFWLVWRA